MAQFLRARETTFRLDDQWSKRRKDCFPPHFQK